MYDFLNRIHVRGWSFAHAVGRLSIVLAVSFSPALALAAACSDAADAAAVSNWNTNQKPQTPWCTATTAVKEIVSNAPYADIVYYYVYGNCTDSGAPYRAIGTFTCSSPSCTAQNDVGTLYANFLNVPYEPSTALGNAASMTAITTAYWALPDQLTVCYSGCAHDLIPNASAPGDVYYSGSGPFVLHREYSADRSNVSCAGPGTGGTSSQGVVTASAVVSAATSSGTGTGSSGSCAPGDTRASCATLDTVQNESIPGVTVTLPGFASETQHFGSGQCPANVFMTFHGINKNLKVWDWQQACQTMVTYVKPVVLVLGAIVALFIVLGIPMPTQSNDQGA